LHSVPSPQVAPTGFLPQLPRLQVVGAMQSLSPVHVVRHCPFVSHWNGAHDVLVAPAQVPAPSQRPAVMSMPSEQPACWQMAPTEYFWQAPAPSHWPVLPQLAAPSSLQAPRGFDPTSAATHVPTEPAIAHV
jgi:hypothetical protein